MDLLDNSCLQHSHNDFLEGNYSEDQGNTTIVVWHLPLLLQANKRGVTAVAATGEEAMGFAAASRVIRMRSLQKLIINYYILTSSDHI